MPNMHTVYIEAPVETVFEFFKDPRNQFAMAPDRRIKLTDVKMTEEGQGTYYSYAMKLAGLTREGFVVYTRSIPSSYPTSSSWIGPPWRCTEAGRTGSNPRAPEQG